MNLFLLAEIQLRRERKNNPSIEDVINKAIEIRKKLDYLNKGKARTLKDTQEKIETINALLYTYKEEKK